LKDWYGIVQRVMHNYEDGLEIDLTLWFWRSGKLVGLHTLTNFFLYWRWSRSDPLILLEMNTLVRELYAYHRPSIQRTFPRQSCVISFTASSTNPSVFLVVPVPDPTFILQKSFSPSSDQSWQFQSELSSETIKTYRRSVSRRSNFPLGIYPISTIFSVLPSDTSSFPV
jgi:hypothetical protein